MLFANIVLYVLRVYNHTIITNLYIAKTIIIIIHFSENVFHVYINIKTQIIS